MPNWGDYYTPDEDVIIEPQGENLYRMKYTITRTLNVGEIIPNSSGNSIGLFYNDWSPWDKTDDFSNTQDSLFLENQKIPVYVGGTRIYGFGPSDGGDPPGDTTTPGDTAISPPPPPSPEDIALQSFALFSTEQSIVRDRSVFSGGGAIGSNGYVEIGIESSITGNVISGGNALLKARATIVGNVTVNDTLTTEDGVNISGVIQENANVGTITIPVRSITPGTVDIPVNPGVTVPLAPGIYRDLTVLSNATLELRTGNYVFNNFVLQPDAHVVFNTSITQRIEIDIQGNFQLSDRATMQLSGFSYAPTVQIYSNYNGNIQIGNDSRVAGIITAPNAVVNMYSRAQCDGAIYARQIIVEPDAIVASNLVDPEGDADGDGLSNYTEVFVTHTDPLDSLSYKEIASPCPSRIDNSSSDVTIDYDPSRFNEDYDSSKIVVKFEENALTVPTVSPALYLSNSPFIVQTDSIVMPHFPGYQTVGRYVVMNQGDMSPTGRAVVGIPVPDEEIMFPSMYSLGILSLSVEEDDWQIETVQASEIQPAPEDPNMVYFEVPAFSALVLLRKQIKATAYLDGGMIYSNGSGAIIKSEAIVRDYIFK